MRIKDSVWQGSFGYWQSLFIHQNILTIGYTAWDGFLTFGRGIVSCEVDLPTSVPVNWSLDLVQHDLRFVGQLQVSDYLQQLELEEAEISKFLQVIVTYNPNIEILLLLMGNGQIEINWMQSLAISPLECYKQVCHRWSEFQPCLIS
jgi:hypothetical protein